MILGIAGSIASGKTFVSQTLLETNCFFYTSFSNILKEYCSKQGITPTREILQNLGKHLIETKGNQGFMEWIISEGNIPTNNVLLDGFRHVDIWHSFKKYYPSANLVFCDVSCKEQIRRICLRDKISEQEALQILNHPIEQDVCRLKTEASVIFSEKTLKEDIIRWVKQSVYFRGLTFYSILQMKSHTRT